MDSDWDGFISRREDALGDLVEGRPEPFKALWSHADDVVIMGAFGGYERGWEQVSARLDWAAAGIASSRAEVMRWAIGRIRENPAYAQIQERAREISELKDRF